MNIYQMRHVILAKHIGKRVTPARLKAELLERFLSVKPQSVNASDCHYSDRKRAGSTCPECGKLGGFAVNRDGVVDMGASGWGNISPVYVPTGNTRNSVGSSAGIPVGALRYEAHTPATITNRIASFRSPQKAVVIDDAFISEWHPKYDWTESDEDEYQQLVAIVSRDLASAGTVSKSTFLRIWNWKGAMRVIGHVLIDAYDNLYAPTFRRAVSEPAERKLAALIAPGVKLPGVEAATGSTLIHFMYPDSMPIIDVRTCEVLFAAGLITTDRKDLAHYEEFRRAIGGIRRRCPRWTLRQIDRALFAYHKQLFDKGGGGCRTA
jgi:hypothetical protein